MKRLWKIMLTGVSVLVIIYLAVGCGSGRNSFEKYLENGNEIRVYEVFGMDCPGCHDGLENLVNKIPGVADSKANWEKQIIQVALNATTDVSDQSVFDAIKKANFTPGKRVR